MGLVDGAAGGSAFGPWGAVAGAGIGLIGQIFGARSQAKATREALDFQKQQAQNSYLNNEVARRANYDQWAARSRRIGSIGEALGYGAREIPAYVAGVNPYYQTDGRPIGMARPGLTRPPGAVSSYL